MLISKIFRTAKISPKQSNRTKICPNESDSDYFGFLFILKLINFQSESVRITFFLDSESLFSDSENNIFSYFSESDRIRPGPKLSETVRNCPKLSDRITSPKSFFSPKCPTESDQISFFIFGLRENFSDSMTNIRTR